MAGQRSIGYLCERALRKIGAYSIRDTGARTDEMEEARHWLDMVVGHVASMKRTWWLVPSTARLTLTAGTTAYGLRSLLPGAPSIQHIVALHTVNLTTGQRDPLPIWRRQEWLERDGTLVAGEAVGAWIDRTRDPVLSLHPAPPATVTEAIDVTYQTFAADQASGTYTQKAENIRDGWNLFLTTRLAAEIGNGPVRKLPQDEVREMQMTAKGLYDDLAAYDDHEQADEPRLVSPYSF
jgi:hypothetical protein